MAIRQIETKGKTERDEIHPEELVNASPGDVFIPVPGSDQAREWEDYVDVRFVKTVGGGITTARTADTNAVSVIVWNHDEIESWSGYFYRTNEDFVFGFEGNV